MRGLPISGTPSGVEKTTVALARYGRAAASRLAGGCSMRRSLAIAFLVTTVTATCFASRTVTDELGRRIVVPDHPHRIICLWPSVTDTVFDLGAGDDVVAVSDYTKYPAAAMKKPSIGSLITPSIETIVALHPDLVIGVQPTGPMESAGQLDRLGIPVFLTNPHGLAGILHSVRTIGLALNRVQEADTLARRLQARVDAVQARTKGMPVPTVFMPIWYDPIITIGKDAFITEIIEAAGGRSVTDDLNEEWPQISMEVLLARSPDALLLLRGGKVSLQALQDRPGWSGLPAVQKRRVYYTDERIELASPIAIDALEDLARQFHP